MILNATQYEVDVPFEENGDAQFFEQLASKEVDWLERTAKAKTMADESDRKTKQINHKIKVNNNGIKLIVACLLGLAFLYICDVVLINFGWRNSDLMNGMFELLKFLLSSLVGFVFAKTTIVE